MRGLRDSAKSATFDNVCSAGCAFVHAEEVFGGEVECEMYHSNLGCHLSRLCTAYPPSLTSYLGPVRDESPAQAANPHANTSPNPESDQ